METCGQAEKGFGGKPIQLTLAPGGEWNGLVGVLEKLIKMEEELAAYHARDLNEARKRGDEAEEKLARAEESLREAEEKRASAAAELEARRAAAEAGARERERLAEEKKGLEETLRDFAWIQETFNACVGVCNDLDELFGKQFPGWYTTDFTKAVCHALMSVRTQLALPSPFVSPTETMLGLDKAFVKCLSGAGAAALEQARRLYMGWFNEQAGGSYRIRWPQPGSPFDPGYCVREEDNGFTGVLTATTCAVYRGEQLTTKARVKTIAR